MSCPTTDTLERLALGFLDDEAAVRAHLKSCTGCAGRLKVFAGEHDALAAAAKEVRLPKIGVPTRAWWKPISIAAACVLAASVAIVLLPATLQYQRASSERSSCPQPVATSAPMREAARSKYFEYSSDPEVIKSPTYRNPPPELRPAEPERPPPPPAPATPGPFSGLTVVPAPSPKPDPVSPEKPKEPPADNVFHGYVPNPTFDTTKETTSTFGLDVDTASYTIVRRYLKDGMLPPADAVRVEEFLNYFRYADPKPPKGAFQVRLEAAPSPFDAARHLLRIAVQAKEIREKERKDCVLTFVIDVSGSMSMENRLELVKRSLRVLVDKLRPTDKVGIVVYGSTGRKLLDPTPARHKAQILGVIDELRTEGSTNLEDGTNIGYKLASDHFDPKATNRVIICTDGVANNGVTDPELLLKNVAQYASKGVWLSVLGFGMGNLNDHLMEKLADKGNGNYAYIDSFKEAKKIFTEKLVGMMEVVAADAKVQVEFDPQTVAEFRQIGYEKRRLANADFRNDKVDAGEVGANHHVTALYEIKLKPGAEGRLATVRLRYREPDTKEVVESQESLSRGQVLSAVKDATPSYRLAASVAEFAECLRGSKVMKLEQILEEASRAAADLDRPEDAVEFVDLVRRAAELRK